jgi:hypothetical protein
VSVGFVGEFAKAINVIRAVDHPVISAPENSVATQISGFRLRAGERIKVAKLCPQSCGAFARRIASLEKPMSAANHQ